MSKLISLDTTTLNFGSVERYDTLELSVTITNIGTEVINITDAGYFDPPFEDITATPFIIPVAESRQMAWRFSPITIGSFSRNGIIAHDATNFSTPIPINLIGEGILNTPTLSVPVDMAVSVAVNPTFFLWSGFGGHGGIRFNIQCNTNIGFPAGPQMIIDQTTIVVNAINSFATLGGNTYYWRVRWSPDGGTTWSGFSEISTFSTVVLAGPLIDIDTTSKNFSDTSVGSVSTTETRLITNNGDAILNLSYGSLTDFELISAPATVAAGGGTAVLSFRFKPITAGAKSENLSITHDGVNAASPLTINLTGNGIAVVNDYPILQWEFIIEEPLVNPYWVFPATDYSAEEDQILNLQWDGATSPRAAEGLIIYYIEYTTDGIIWIPIDNGNPTGAGIETITFNTANYDPGQYRFRVRAYDGTLYSDWVESSYLQIILVQPTGIIYQDIYSGTFTEDENGVLTSAYQIPFVFSEISRSPYIQSNSASKAGRDESKDVSDKRVKGRSIILRTDGISKYQGIELKDLIETINANLKRYSAGKFVPFFYHHPKDGDRYIKINNVPSISIDYIAGTNHSAAAIEIELKSDSPFFVNKDLIASDEVISVGSNPVIINNQGTFITFPVFTFTAGAGQVDNELTITNAESGQSFTYTRTVVVNDEIVIDTSLDESVSFNGVYDIGNFVGRFINFETGINNLTINSDVVGTLEIEYRHKYL